MDKYLLFAGAYDYPAGGWKDYINSFSTVESAQKSLNKNRNDSSHYFWAHIVDSETGEIVSEKEDGEGKENWN